MKRYAILTVVVLAILVVAWTAFGQEEGDAERIQQAMETLRQRYQNMSDEERQQAMETLRKRIENMSEEEKEKLWAVMRERSTRSRGLQRTEALQKSIKAIEEQLAKLKTAQVPRFEGRFQDLSKEERAKLGEKIRKFRQDQQQALQIITDQVARLYGRSQLEGEGERYLIVSTNDLKQIQESATKEKAKETSQLQQDRSTIVPITVPDAGFDDQIVDAGDWAYIGSDYLWPWQHAGGDAWIDNGYYAGDVDLPARSGNNKLYGNDDTADHVYQILDETFVEGEEYTLSVWVGIAWIGYANEHSIYSKNG